MNVGAIGFERSGFGSHFNLFGLDAEFKLGVHAHDVILVEKNAGSDKLTEPDLGDFHLVRAGGYCGDRVESGVIGYRFANFIRRFFRDLD